MADIELNNKFTRYQNIMDCGYEIREAIKGVCKDMDRVAREMTNILQTIHHSELNITRAPGEARAMFHLAHDGYQKLKDALSTADYYKYYENWRHLNQKFSFIITLTIWLEKGILAQHDTVADILGIHTLEENGFHIEVEDYLIGVLNLCNELARLAVNSVARCEYNRPLQISKFVIELSSAYRGLYIRHDHLRKRYEALKHDIKKIEEVVYDLSIRGLGEPVKTGDLPIEEPTA